MDYVGELLVTSVSRSRIDYEKWKQFLDVLCIAFMNRSILKIIPGILNDTKWTQKKRSVKSVKA